MTAAELAEALRFARAALVRLDEAAVLADLGKAEVDRIAAAARAFTDAVAAACARRAGAATVTGAMLPDPEHREAWGWFGAFAAAGLAPKSGAAGRPA